LPRRERAISAAQLQRELLFALSGRPGILLSFEQDSCSVSPQPTALTQIVPGHPDVVAFTPAALEGILFTFAGHARQAARLRRFISETLAGGHSETAEAFAAACQGVLHDVANWVAEREEAFLGTTEQTVSTPLVLEREFARFGDILDALCGLLPLAGSPVALLDALYEATTSPVALDIRPQLTDVFAQAAAPMWRMVGDWLVQGMPVPESLSSQEADLALQEDDTERALPAEFFIQRDRDAAWIDEDFWEAGFVVSLEGWPAWLASVRADVLEGGKARGLLHSLPAEHEGEAWRALPELLSPDADIGEALCAFVAPICRGSQSLLADTLERECGLQAHLAAIDGLSLMRAFDVLDTWADWLFGQMAARKPWSDFHLLTHAMRDAIESAGARWMNPAAVRVRTARRRAELGDIRVDYLVR
jgi:gamma-tubulin complex component 5